MLCFSDYELETRSNNNLEYNFAVLVHIVSTMKYFKH
jgi:hypothetical protein